MQLLFENEYKNGEKTGIIYFMPNHDILPIYAEIDVIINRLKKLKKEMTDKEIKLHNKKRYKEMSQEMSRMNMSAKTLKSKTLKSGYVYLLKSNNLYKIGRTTSFKSRMKKYTTENPFGIKLILQKKVDDYIGIEKKLLDKFKEKQVRGEWFKLNKGDIKEFKKMVNEI